MALRYILQTNEETEKNMNSACEVKQLVSILSISKLPLDYTKKLTVKNRVQQNIITMNRYLTQNTKRQNNSNGQHLIITTKNTNEHTERQTVC